MAIYTPLSDLELKYLADFFEIGKIKNSATMNGGAANSNYLLRTEKDRFVLSVCDEKKHHQVEGLVELLGILEESGFPTTRVVNPVGKPKITSFRGKPVFVKKYIEGEVRQQLTTKNLLELGRTIARLHEIPAPSTLPKNFPYGVDYFSQVIETESVPYSEWLDQFSKRIISATNRDLPTGLVHGDIFYNNLLFNDASLVAVLDFEEAANHHSIFDLGMSIVGTCTEDGDILYSKAKKLVQGYQEVRPLSDMEKESLQDFVIYGAVATSFWRFRQYNLIQGEREKLDEFRDMTIIADNASKISPKQFLSDVF